MDVDGLVREARAMNRAQFGQKYPGLFFLMFEEEEEVSSPAVAAAQFWTEVAEKGDSGKTGYSGILKVLPLVKAPNNPYPDRISIGRARNCDVVLRHRSVSKLHAHAKRDENGAWVLQDAGSHNGMIVAGRAVEPNGAAAIASGQNVVLGAVTLRVVDGEELHVVLTRLSHAQAHGGHGA
jgi:FHA domain